MRQEGGTHLAGLAARREGPRGLHQIAVLALEAEFAFRARQRFPMIFFERGLVLPEVHVRRAAGTENMEHLLRLGGKVRAAGRAEDFELKQPREGYPGETRSKVAQESPSVDLKKLRIHSR